MSTTSGEQLRCSRSLVVLFGPRGLAIPSYGEHAEVALDLAALQLIEAMASSAGLTVAEGGLDEAGDQLVSELEARGLLRRGPASDERSEVAYDESEVNWVSAGPAVDLDSAYMLPTLWLFGCSSNGFEFVTHDGTAGIRLRAADLVAMAAFRGKATLAEALDRLSEQLGPEAPDAISLELLLARLVAVGLVVQFVAADPALGKRSQEAALMQEAMRRQAAVHEEFERLDEARDAAWTGGDRVRVVAYHPTWAGPPASLGALLAAAKGYEGGALEQAYDFRARLCWDLRRMASAAAGPPTIFLFSNYVWNTTENLGMSRMVKDQHPHHLAVHGGPNTPKYEDDCIRWFAEHPHVDVAVHGEGEVTFCEMLAALRGSGGDRRPDLSCLADVPGLTFRDGDRIVRTAARDRVADINTLPSPILTGLFDGFMPAGGAVTAGLTMETNRGCPYGCTFCDWGSATLSRVRKFDLDRVFAELEWAGRNGFKLSIADANFGIFERDVEIATEIARLKVEMGHPRSVGLNYAKNTVKHLSKIIQTFTEAGIVAEGKMSLQTFDEGTLTTIRRKNIKLEQYNNMSIEFRRNELPMSVDIMMGLPGSTLDTLRDDLQECVDRDVRTYLYPTLLLPNSPMNEPSYRQENGITAIPGETVRETSSYTRLEWEQMNRLKAGFWVFENFGILRQIGTYARSETGRREMDIYEQLINASVDDPERWPTVAITDRVLHELMVPPVSWMRLHDEVRRFLVEEVGIADDDALATVMTVQHALQPARDRSFPITMTLPHDYAAWHALVRDARNEGHAHDWSDHVPPLRSFGPATFTVDDPLDYSRNFIAQVFQDGNSWDLVSPVARTTQIVG